MINPSSGDKSASLFAGPDASNQILDSVPKGTLLKVTGSSGNFYNVEYDSGMPNVFHGGTEMTGTIVAYPSAPMYSDTTKTSIVGYVNNGTPCEILNDLHPTMIQLEATTTDGKKSGYVEVKFIYCDSDYNTENVQRASTFNLRMRAAKTLNDYANEVIRGDWGNGVARKEKINAAYNAGTIPYDYETIQTRVNAILRGETIPASGPEGTGQTGTVTAKSGLNVRSGPGTSYYIIRALMYGEKVTIYDTKNGWHKISNSKEEWVSGEYIQLDGTNTEASVPKADTTPVTPPEVETMTSDGDDWVAAGSSFSRSNLENTVNDEYYRQLAIKYSNALGAPPKYNSNIDVRYMEVANNMDDVSSCGRVINKTILSNPSILSICPGKARMFPNLMGTERDSVVEAMLGASNGNQRLYDKIMADDQGRFSGRLYKFEADTAEYAKYLNTLCRSCAVLLGIGDEEMPETKTKLKQFDYAYWSIRKRYNPTSAGSDVGDGSLFRSFGSNLVKTAEKIMTAAVDDTTYINFFLNGNETSIAESVSNNISDSPLSSISDSVSSVASMLNYFTGSAFDVGDASIQEALNSVVNSGDGISGLLNVADNFIKGGKMVLPKMVNDAQYGKSISCNMKFVSPYGNKMSVFVRCLVPICHLVALAVPRQLADNMFTYPF